MSYTTGGKNHDFLIILTVTSCERESQNIPINATKH